MLDMCHSNIMGLKSTGVPLKLPFFAYGCQEFLLIDIPKMNSSSIKRSLKWYDKFYHQNTWLSIGPSSWKNWTVTHLDPIPLDGPDLLALTTNSRHYVWKLRRKRQKESSQFP